MSNLISDIDVPHDQIRILVDKVQDGAATIRIAYAYQGNDMIELGPFIMQQQTVLALPTKNLIGKFNDA